MKDKKFIFQAIMVVIFVCGIVLCRHFSAHHRQAQRELIYIKATQEAAQQRRERQLEYEKRRREAQLRREYNQGQVVGSVSLSAQP